MAEITIPRLPDESARAYAARVDYVTAGPGRSLEKLQQKIGKNTSYVRQLSEWSSRYGWVESARRPAGRRRFDPDRCAPNQP